MTVRLYLKIITTRMLPLRGQGSVWQFLDCPHISFGLPLSTSILPWMARSGPWRWHWRRIPAPVVDWRHPCAVGPRSRVSSLDPMLDWNGINQHWVRRNEASHEFLQCLKHANYIVKCKCWIFRIVELQLTFLQVICTHLLSLLTVTLLSFNVSLSIADLRDKYSDWSMGYRPAKTCRATEESKEECWWVTGNL